MLQMQDAWRHTPSLQAPAYAGKPLNFVMSVADARRPMKAGTPFTRPALTHPKLVGAAGTVPNNMLKHKWKPAKYGCRIFDLDMPVCLLGAFRCQPLDLSLHWPIDSCQQYCQ